MSNHGLMETHVKYPLLYKFFDERGKATDGNLANLIRNNIGGYQYKFSDERENVNC